MSFEEQIRRKKSSLKHSTTLVTTPAGDVLLEERRGDETTVIPVAKSEGFVIDKTPDLQVAEILPGLYLGSQDAAQNEEILKKYNITRVLSLGVNVEKISGISFDFIPALDLPEFNLRSMFEHCFAIIDAEREQGGRIFVHCNAGVSRSATVVIAYVMKEMKIPFPKALDLVRKARPVVQPNTGFVNQLIIFGRYLSSFDNSN